MVEHCLTKEKNETKFQRWAGSCKAVTADAALTSLWPYLRRHNTTRIASRGGNGSINLFPFTRPPFPPLFLFCVDSSTTSHLIRYIKCLNTRAVICAKYLPFWSMLVPCPTKKNGKEVPKWFSDVWVSCSLP